MVEFCNMTQEHHLVANWNNLSWKCYLVVELRYLALEHP